MVYLLKMVIFHGYVSHNQRVCCQTWIEHQLWTYLDQTWLSAKRGHPFKVQIAKRAPSWKCYCGEEQDQRSARHVSVYIKYIHVYNGCVYIYIHRILIYCILITSSEGFSFRNSATTREKNLIVLKASTNEGKPCWNVLGFFISQDRMWEIVISFGNQTLHGESTSWGFNAKIIYL